MRFIFSCKFSYWIDSTGPNKIVVKEKLGKTEESKSKKELFDRQIELFMSHMNHIQGNGSSLHIYRKVGVLLNFFMSDVLLLLLMLFHTGIDFVKL